MALNLEAFSAALDTFLPPSASIRPARRRRPPETLAADIPAQNSKSPSPPTTRAPSAFRSGSTGRPPIAPSPSPPSSMVTNTIVDKLAMALDQHMIRGVRTSSAQVRSASGEAGSNRGGPSPTLSRPLSPQSRSKPSKEDSKTRTISVGGSQSPTSSRPISKLVRSASRDHHTPNTVVDIAKAQKELFGSKTSHVPDVERLITIYGPSLVMSVEHGSGSGAHKVTQLYSVHDAPTSRQISPQGVWSTNPMRESAGAVLVVALHMPSIRLKSETDLTRQVKTETSKDLMLHIVTDQIPSAGSAILIASSHHPSAGFVTIARQSPFMANTVNGSAPPPPLQECILVLKGSLVAPYLRITIVPKKEMMSTIRISYVSVMAADTTSTREVSVEPSAHIAKPFLVSPARDHARAALLNSPNHHDQSYSTNHAVVGDTPSPVPTNPAPFAFQGGLNHFAEDSQHKYSTVGPQNDKSYSAPTPEPFPQPQFAPQQQPPPSIYSRTTTAVTPPSSRYSKLPDDALDVVLSPNTPKMGGGGSGVATGHITPNATGTYSVNASMVNTSPSSSYWLSGSPNPAPPVHASTKLAEILFSSVKADAMTIASAVQSASAEEVTALLTAMRSRSESRQVRLYSPEYSPEYSSIEGGSRSPTVEALERSRQRRREAALATEQAEREAKTDALAAMLIREQNDVVQPEERHAGAPFALNLNVEKPLALPREQNNTELEISQTTPTKRPTRHGKGRIVTASKSSVIPTETKEGVDITPKRKDPTDALGAKISRLQESFETLARRMAEKEEIERRRDEEAKQQQNLEKKSRNTSHGEETELREEAVIASGNKQSASQKRKEAWDDMPTVRSLHDLIMAGCVLDKQNIRKTTQSSELVVQICLQPSIARDPHDGSSRAAHIGEKHELFFASDVAGYLSMPYTHFVIAIDEERLERNKGSNTTSLFSSFDAFCEAISQNLTTEYQENSFPMIRFEPIARCRLGFVVKVGHQRFIITTQHGQSLIEDLHRFNEHYNIVPAEYLSSSWPTSSTFLVSKSHSKKAGLPAQSNVVLEAVAWLDFPARDFENLLEGILSLRRNKSQTREKVGKKNFRTEPLTYFAALQSSEVSRALDEATNLPSSAHPLLAFADATESALPISKRSNSSLHIPPTFWSSHLIKGFVEDNVLNVTFTACQPKEWILVHRNKGRSSRQDEGGASTTRGESSQDDYTPSESEEEEDESPPRRKENRQKSVVIRTGHILDLLVGWYEESDDEMAGGVVVSPCQLGCLKRIVGGDFIPRALSTGRLQVLPVAIQSNRSAPFSSGKRDISPLSSTVLHSMVAALERKWDSVAIWIDGEAGASLEQLIPMLGQWGFGYPSQVILYCAEPPRESVLVDMGFKEAKL